MKNLIKKYLSTINCQLSTDKGQTLIEVLIAMGAGIIILSAMVTLVIKSLSNSQYSKYQGMASQYSQEGMEVLRSERDSNWVSFSASLAEGTTYCFGEDQVIRAESSCVNPNIDATFVRKVERIRASDDLTNYKCAGGGIAIVVTVSWKDGKCTTDPYCNKARLDSCFYNLKTLPTP